jgi:predicted ATP-grasp superfamily ATP-dependent carboligase
MPIPFEESPRLLVVAFEGWNDAGDSATQTAQMIIDQKGLVPITAMDPEPYFDYQVVRPVVEHGPDGARELVWPDVRLYEHPDPAADAPLVLLGQEPSRLWFAFVAEMVEHFIARDVQGIVFLGAMLADVPHSRPVRVTATSDDPGIRGYFDIEKSTYEGPVGVLTVLAFAAAEAGIPSMNLWAHVPHYVHTSPSPKATLALAERLEELVGINTDREELQAEALRWAEGIDALAAEDDDMTAYIDQLEKARDAADAPEASGDAIAQEFEKYLDSRPDRPGSAES